MLASLTPVLAAEVLPKKTGSRAVQTSSLSKPLVPSKRKANSAKNLGVIPGIDLAKTPQLLTQITEPTSPSPGTEPSNTAPVTEPTSPPSGTDPSNTAPATEPTSPPSGTEPSNTAPATEPTSPPSTVPSSSEPQFPSGEQVKPDPNTVDPGRRTRSGSSYIGIGANVGGFGKTSVGSPGLMLYSKIGLTRYFSVRPAVVTDFSMMQRLFCLQPLILPLFDWALWQITRFQLRPILEQELLFQLVVTPDH
ncbi:MAG: hypothetical protein HC852_05260 [Acaryochloridaceae cyanobacterium RU_4_10]|nr:hypothetical protein [Acaryochloridaceae cyanobacterium RU_4_10]